MQKAQRFAALIGITLVSSGCSLIDTPAKDDGPVHIDKPTSGDQGQELDSFFNGIAFGNNVISPEIWEGKIPVSTGEADAPVITSAPAAVRIGPNRDKATFPIRFTDVTMLDANQAPNRLVVKLRGVDWRWWEYPMDPQGFIDRMPEGYEYSVWLRAPWQELVGFGPQVLELAFAEKSGKVGEFVPLEVTVGETAVGPYKDLSCPQLAQRLNDEAAVEGYDSDYTCVDDQIICRHAPALDAHCGAAASADLVMVHGPGAEALTPEQATRGVVCRGAYALKPYKYDDMTGVPFDPRPWDASLGSIESMNNCLGVLTEPGVKDDVFTRGLLCCQ